MASRKQPVRHVGVSDEEGKAIAALVKELEGMSGQPFAHDPPVWARELPAHVLTPRRIRNLVRDSLRHLVRHELIAEKFLAELTIGGRSFLELEAGHEVRHA